MKRLWVYIPIILFFTLVQSCAVHTWSDYDTDVTKGDYSTYQMFVHDTDVHFGTNPINKIRIENALNQELRSIGLSLSDDPDLVVKFFVKLDQKQFIETCNNTYNRYEGGDYCIERIVYYDQGTLVVDIIDAKANKIIWHGVAEGAPLDKEKDPQQKINRIVSKLIKELSVYRENYLIR